MDLFFLVCFFKRVFLLGSMSFFVCFCFCLCFFKKMGTQTLRCTDYSRAGSWHVAVKLPRLFGNCGLVSTANNRKENFLRSKSKTTNMVFGQFQRFNIFYCFISILLLTFIGIPRSMCYELDQYQIRLYL